jgi:uncharacterized protein (DUF2267 family)
MDPKIFESTVNKTNMWLHELSEEIGMEERDTYKSLRATLHLLRDRLTVEEATDLAAQLPLLLKGVYYDGYDPSRTPVKMDGTTLISRVHSYFDNDPDVDPEYVVTGVLDFLNEKISKGQMEHVKSDVPNDIKELLG